MIMRDDIKKASTTIPLDDHMVDPWLLPAPPDGNQNKPKTGSTQDPKPPWKDGKSHSFDDMFQERKGLYFLDPKHRHVLKDWQMRTNKLKWSISDTTQPNETAVSCSEVAQQKHGPCIMNPVHEASQLKQTLMMDAEKNDYVLPAYLIPLDAHGDDDEAFTEGEEFIFLTSTDGSAMNARVPEISNPEELDAHDEAGNKASIDVSTVEPDGEHVALMAPYARTSNASRVFPMHVSCLQTVQQHTSTRCCWDVSSSATQTMVNKEHLSCVSGSH
jgi:hypothetical protein